MKGPLVKIVCSCGITESVVRKKQHVTTWTEFRQLSRGPMFGLLGTENKKISFC